MLKVNIIAVGKLKEKYFTDACNEYIKRLGAFCSISVTEIAEHKCPHEPSQADIAATVNDESKRILAAVGATDTVVALCIEGKEYSSEQLAKLIDDFKMRSSSGRVCFIIGGSWGLSDEVKRRADVRLSMSPMTFPHMLARVMLLEQIYRAFGISAGSKYHK